MSSTGAPQATSPIPALAGPVPLVRKTWSVYKWPLVQLLNGGAGLYQDIMFYNYTFSTPLEAPRGQALIGIGFAIGLLLGPIVGGAFADNYSTTWSWAMYINIPVLVFLVVGWIFFLPALHLGQTTGRPAAWLCDIDILGWLIHSAFFVMLCSTLIFSGTRWAWDSDLCTAAWGFTAILGTVHVTQQAFCIFTTPGDSIFPVRVLCERTSVLLVLSVAMAAAAYGISLYYTPLFFAFTQDATPLEAGLDLMPFIGSFVGTTILANVLLPRFRLYAPLYVLGGSELIGGQQLTAELRRKVVEGVTEVIRKLYFIVVAAGALILVCGCFMPWGKLNLM